MRFRSERACSFASRYVRVVERRRTTTDTRCMPALHPAGRKDRENCVYRVYKAAYAVIVDVINLLQY